jgi:putative FmdB family regulatory protein
MGILYTHECRSCYHIWELYYSIKTDPPSFCPNCNSQDVFRQVGSSGFILTGSGWAQDGYYHLGAYDRIKGLGQEVTRYDSKEDLDREMKGEAEGVEKAKLKRLNAVSKKTMGDRFKVTEAEAEKKIKKAGEDAVSTPD